jgi:hypothetical protein
MLSAASSLVHATRAGLCVKSGGKIQTLKEKTTNLLGWLGVALLFSSSPWGWTVCKTWREIQTVKEKNEGFVGNAERCILSRARHEAGLWRENSNCKRKDDQFIWMARRGASFLVHVMGLDCV